MLPTRAPDYRSAGPQSGWCTIRMLNGQTYVFATAGINLVRRLQTQLISERKLKAYTDPIEVLTNSALTVNGRFDAATAKALLAAVDERSPVWAPNVRAEIQARAIGPSIMLATLWLAYEPLWTLEQAYARIVPWGSSLYVHMYTPLPWDTALPETAALSRDVIYSWREDEPAPPLASNDRDQRRAEEDARARVLVANPRDGTIPFLIAGTLSIGLLTYAIAQASQEN